ncbi:DUF2630 domain-containing protein [Streptomyces lunaelactis]|uniref:DUF2630 domain-containing protein n=1 Tax=Streptomyces lunaelactis TaxID=1535768 RepID=A0A2R4T502_9ACTN|nr:DUF2630 family protein [Streptomyces lunaelactis]AVZ74198.1 DUF2630 domain-containing protein [Streptomyces lunaelactis]NUK03597.1 DUF2630 family protein [Streptomyces lunaelactis]NUK10452.1 DUF2630 family protein [Streptomyces lunaelactis]NUK18020.1 DUF2630 family protein [Streptomyces lunaelactis]NUK25296.1 DUF2630 family protein [Streptomyces lunaelactis]
MDNDRILGNITALVAEERTLRERSTEEHGLDSGEQARLRALEVQLDQCWDLLRQRRAKSEFGEDPGTAKVRPPDEVEGYLG